MVIGFLGGQESLNGTIIVIKNMMLHAGARGTYNKSNII